MKLLCSVFLACSVVTLAPGSAWAQKDEPSIEDGVRFDAVAYAKASVSVKDATPDEFLVAVARAGDVNIIADATMPEGAAPIAGSITRDIKGGAVSAFLSDLAETENVRFKYFGDRTFLVWRPPHDSTGVAQQIVDEFMAARRALPPLSSAQVLQSWDGYFREKHLWDGGHEATIEVKIADLPSPLRERALVQAQEALMPLFLAQPDFFVPEAWQKAHLVVGSTVERNGQPPVPYLYWREPVPGGLLSINVGRLDALARRPR